MHYDDFLDLCKQRQSCRGFSDQPVEHDKLVLCVEAGRLAHSGCNAQPWSFAVVENPDMVTQIAQCGQQLKQNVWLETTKAFIIIFEEHAVLSPVISCFLDSQYYAKGDLGAAAAYVCLEAASQGLGSCIIGLYDRKKICELLHIQRDKQFGSVIALGYPPNDIIRPKKRKAFEDIVRFV
ncbi:nitroreductase family protein [Leadbettera azotonutricia]|uniref:Nitroreductase n=1 Tax=Leadbettera azotonutricia (strain ATCC BAA-888 / DSM 13862 / ZAS-9) TaxID=545695 RepID=F5YFS9_LEAAZ|nr:nitroreductase family protein [Leadbettera azotonutricia]AEF80697.1 nitroreductase [Leadbettera azotonutricia ZAS-9]